MDEDELIAAVRARLLADAPAPATADEVREAERQLGFALPPLLRRMYLEVSNGAWGPEYGANGLIGGARVDLDAGAVEWYRQMHDGGADPEDPSWPGWPDGLLAVCHWGCAIWSCVDCNSSDGRVVRFDPNGYGPPDGTSWSGAWGEERPSLAAFLEDWLSDRLRFMPPSPSPPCPTPSRFGGPWRV